MLYNSLPYKNTEQLEFKISVNEVNIYTLIFGLETSVEQLDKQEQLYKLILDLSFNYVI